MSNEHAVRIHRLVEGLRPCAPEEERGDIVRQAFTLIDDETDALAAGLNYERKRADRLQGEADTYANTASELDAQNAALVAYAKALQNRYHNLVVELVCDGDPTDWFVDAEDRAVEELRAAHPEAAAMLAREEPE